MIKVSLSIIIRSRQAVKHKGDKERNRKVNVLSSRNPADNITYVKLQFANENVLLFRLNIRSKVASSDLMIEKSKVK